MSEIQILPNPEARTEADGHLQNLGPKRAAIPCAGHKLGPKAGGNILRDDASFPYIPRLSPGTPWDTLTHQQSRPVFFEPKRAVSREGKDSFALLSPRHDGQLEDDLIPRSPNGAPLLFRLTGL